MVTKRSYKLAGRQNTPPAKMRVIPDQSLSIREIVRRFTKGLPVDVKQREAVYIDQDAESEIDFEKVSRMDFADKVQFAQDLRQETEQRVRELDERIVAQRKESEDAKKRAAQSAEPSGQEKKAGEDPRVA